MRYIHAVVGSTFPEWRNQDCWVHMWCKTSTQRKIYCKINLLKMKRRLLYLKTQSVPRCKHVLSQL